MNRDEYRSLLGQLSIKNPTAEDMARLCPHISKEQAVEAFTTGNGYVACPPLLVRNGFQILSYHKEWVEEIEVWRGYTRVVQGTKNHPPRLDWSYAGRTKASYADGKLHGDVLLPYKHMEEAIRFAEDNWGDELILDSWNSVGQIYVQDPTDLVNDRYHTNHPRTKAILYIALNRDWNTIINDHSKPQSELIDEAIMQMTLDTAVWHEIKGGRGGFTEFNCAHCGAGLSLSSCTGCGYTFDDDQFRSGWHTPLSKKMVAFLRKNNHTFHVDPKVAWKKEHEKERDC